MADAVHDGIVPRSPVAGKQRPYCATTAQVWALHDALPQPAAHVRQWPSGSGQSLLTGADGGQLSTWALERAMRTARAKVDGLPAGFRYHGTTSQAS